MVGYNNIDDTSIYDFQMRQHVIKKLKKRFSTYGYKQVRTSTFEAYDLYTQTNGLVNHNEMIKTIDNTGQVLVLRPDITIPITRQIAANKSAISNELRYFYVLNVFRQSLNDTTSKESTQAGIEYFGKNSIEVDAEIIALAVHILKDLKFDHFKIEIGHAGFLKELINKVSLQPKELKQLTRLIQAKNRIEIEPFLTSLSIDSELIKTIQQIPLLYGSPKRVFERAKEMTLSKQMDDKLQNIIQIYEVLKEYQVEDFINIDLGLINHMDYYSDIVFQGFVDNIGKPILMGGRYDNLANQFNASVPAIGFAFDVETLLEGTKNQIKASIPFIDLTIFYDDTSRKDSLMIANELRNQLYHVLTYPVDEIKNDTNASFIVSMKQNEMTLQQKDKKQPIKNIDELLHILQRNEEEA